MRRSMAYKIRSLKRLWRCWRSLIWIVLVPGKGDDASMHLRLHKRLDGYSSRLEVHQVPELRHEQMIELVLTFCMY